jgi:hypothetical protein
MGYFIAAIVLGMLIWALGSRLSKQSAIGKRIPKKLPAKFKLKWSKKHIAVNLVLMRWREGVRLSETHSTPATAPPKLQLANLLQVRSVIW